MCEGRAGLSVIEVTDKCYRSPEYAFSNRTREPVGTPLARVAGRSAIAVKHRILLKKSARRSIATLTQLDTDWLTFCDARLYPVAAR